MRASRIAALLLLTAGTVGLVALSIRIAVYWVVEPANEPLVAAVGVALGTALSIATSARLRGRPARAAGVLLAAGLVLTAAVRALDATVPAPGAGFVPYGPGTPPSFSWLLLDGQVVVPTVTVAACTLVAAALALLIGAVARRVAAVAHA